MHLTNALQVLAGIGLFIFGIKLLSDALQSIAGEKMRQLIGMLTRTPFRGVLIGTLVTILIQSSSGVTVMSVSFVNAGLMTLSQAIGVIMGANIGTTVTAQIIAFKIKNIALPFLAIGAFFAILGRTQRQKQWGNAMMGFGLLFLGMQTMEHSMHFLRDRQDLFMALGSPLVGVLVGTLVTMVVQSSSATIGLTIAMASQGLLDIHMALPIILGDNIGTTITAVVAAIGTNRSAQQAAAAHVFFNVIGVCIFMLAMPIFKTVVMHTADDIGRQLANAHTIFNVTNTLLFLPFAKQFARFIRWLLPDKEEQRIAGPLYLDSKLINASPAAAVKAVKNEILHMGHTVQTMSGTVREAFATYDEKMLAIFANHEKSLNTLNHAIARYSSDIWQSRISPELSSILGKYVSVAGDWERIGDHLENIMESIHQKAENKINFSAQADAEFWDMFNTVDKALQKALQAIDIENTELANNVIHDMEVSIDNKEKQYRANHISRMACQECSAEHGVIFIDILRNLERIGDHSHNIAYFAKDISTHKL